MNKKVIILVGPPGSGKSTRAKKLESLGFIRISQDDQGKDGHFKLFIQALCGGQNVVIDRMNFDKKQRNKYIKEIRNINTQYGEEFKYKIKIVVIHEASSICMKRMLERKDHPTIKDEQSAKSALHTFMSKYERPTEDEADEILFDYPYRKKLEAIICDLDGTLCDIEHRRHYVRRDNGKKDWRGFFSEMHLDKVNTWCASLLISMDVSGFVTLYCTGRGEEYREKTQTWIENNQLDFFGSELFMRQEKDSRADWLIKENILDFEILTQYTPVFAIDDRQQVVDMWRRRGIVCLQCDIGDF